MPTLVGVTSVGGSSTVGRTGTEAVGTGLGDIDIGLVYIEPSATVTPPSGWTQVFNGTTMAAACVTGGSAFQAKAYWIRRGTAAPDLAWVWSGSLFNRVTISTWRGAVSVGDPFSFGVSAVRDTTASRTFPDVSGTTLRANETLIWLGQGFDSIGAGTQPTTFTEDYDLATGPGVEVAHKDQAAAGATGTVTGASYTVSGSANTTMSMMFGLMPLAATPLQVNAREYRAVAP